MKIIEMNIYQTRIPLKIPYSLSHTSIKEIEPVIVEMVTESCKGYGEATSLKNYNKETVESIISSIKLMRNNIVGRDLDQKELKKKCNIFAKKNHFAFSAIETAFFDAFSREQGVDFSDLLGGCLRKKCRLVGSIGIQKLDTTVSSALEYADQRFETLKIKIGEGVEKDIKKIIAIREKLSEIKIRLDANEAYNFNQATKLISGLKGMDIDLIEQPMPRGYLDKYAKLRENSNLPIMLDEDIYTIKDVLKIIKIGSADYIKTKLMKTGVSDTEVIGKILEESEMGLIFGNGVETDVAAFAELKIASSIPKINITGEFVGPLKLKHGITNKKFEVKQGMINVEKEKGLGFDLNLSKMKKCG